MDDIEWICQITAAQAVEKGTVFLRIVKAGKAERVILPQLPSEFLRL